MLTSGISLLSHGNLANGIFEKRRKPIPSFLQLQKSGHFLLPKVISDKVVNWE